MLPMNEKSTATGDVIINIALTKHTHHKIRIHEGFHFILLFPNQMG